MKYLFLTPVIFFFFVFSPAVTSGEILYKQYTNGSLLKSPKDPKVYLIWNNSKRHIADERTFHAWSWRWKDVQEVSRGDLDQYSDGDPIQWRELIFPQKITVHEHYREKANLEAYFRVAKDLDIGMTVFVPTGMNPDNRGYREHMAELLNMQKEYPKQIAAFCTVDEQDQDAVKILEDCFQKGGQGLKILGGHPDFYDEPLDSENMHRILEVVRKHKKPVLAHVSIINLPKADAEFRRILSDFPDITVVFAHYCSSIMSGVHLDKCEEYLNTYPNLYVDLTMGGGMKRYLAYMKQDIQPFRDFILKFQDRIFYGSDIILTKSKSYSALKRRMRCDIDLLTQKDYLCDQQTEKNEVLPGLYLPKEALQKIFIDNPKKILKDW